ncbi:MAG: MBOAT family O-acyltransferase [Oscillospiraceae bacterium]
MVFSDLLFLFLFLPLNLLIQRFTPTIRGKNWVMLLFSLFFYAWGEPVYVLLLIGMSFVNWRCSLVIRRRKRAGLSAKPALVLACVVSLGILSVFKYGMFLLENLQALTGLAFPIPEIALPIGISFYTFQALTYTIDVYRGDAEAQDSFPMLLMYVSLFHQCIAGPIVRYRDVAEEIGHRRATTEDMARGVRRFTCGLAKKALLANPCGALADSILLSTDTAADLSLAAENLAALSGADAAALWLGVLAWMLQIYLDFSAYSDMAIGMGLMVGFHYRENFNYPYTAASVSEFWRRWHISLGSFFRDYVYIPLGGNRRGQARTVLNLLIVWFLTGLWHGASWNYVLWGLYFFLFIALEKLLAGRFSRAPKLLGHLYLLCVVFFGWILFRFEDLRLGGAVLRGMFRFGAASFETRILWQSHWCLLLVCILACTPLCRALGTYLTSSRAPRPVRTVSRLIGAVLPVALLLLSAAALAGDSYNPFIYFQF